MLNQGMRNLQLAALLAVAGMVSAPPAMAQDYNAEGCRYLEPECRDSRARWDEDSDTVSITRVTNRCGVRITMRLCNETENDGAIKWICHNYALSDGESIEQTTFFSTGNYKEHAVGSRSSATDSTCRRGAGIKP